MFIPSLLLLAATPTVATDGGSYGTTQQVTLAQAAPQSEAPVAPAVATTAGASDKAADDKATDDKARHAKASSRKGTFLVIIGIISTVLGVSVLS